jgi:hypothetical protein
LGEEQAALKFIRAPGKQMHDGSSGTTGPSHGHNDDHQHHHHDVLAQWEELERRRQEM